MLTLSIMCIYSTANICYCAYDQGEPRELLLPLKRLCHKCLGVSRGQNSKSMSMSFFDNDDGYHHLCILSALQNHCRHHQQQQNDDLLFQFFWIFPVIGVRCKIIEDRCHQNPCQKHSFTFCIFSFSYFPIFNSLQSSECAAMEKCKGKECSCQDNTCA